MSKAELLPVVTFNYAGQITFLNDKRLGMWDLLELATSRSEMLLDLVVTQKIAHAHSELSEAFEALRTGRWFRSPLPEPSEFESHTEYLKWFSENVKDSVEDELTDALLVIVGLMYSRGIDIDSHIRAKMAYNSSREHKHGKRF